jgi:hypothetical protein
VVIPATSQADTTVVSCPTGGGGDQITRGFYVSDYPGSNLGRVTLTYFPLAPPPISITLTARAGTYDGPIVGTATVSVSPPETATFDFGGAPVAPGSTITFAHSIGGGDPDGYAYFDYGEASLGNSSDPNACPGVTETDGTAPPLDNFRRASMGLTITALPAPPATPSVTPAPQTGPNPNCKRLRKKLKRQKRHLASATASEKRAEIQTNIADTKHRLQRLGCR